MARGISGERRMLRARLASGCARSANAASAGQDPNVSFQLLWDQYKARQGNNFAELYFGAFGPCFWLARWQR